MSNINEINLPENGLGMLTPTVVSRRETCVATAPDSSDHKPKKSKPFNPKQRSIDELL